MELLVEILEQTQTVAELLESQLKTAGIKANIKIAENLEDIKKNLDLIFYSKTGKQFQLEILNGSQIMLSRLMEVETMVNIVTKNQMT